MLTTSVKKATPLSLSNILAGSSGTSGFSNGTGTAARFSSPANMVYDGSNNLYVSDAGNHSIRKITLAGVVTTYAGTGSSGSANGNGTSASFNTPAGLAIDSSSNLYVADSGNDLIRKITTARDVTTFPFTMTGPSQIAVDSTGENMIAIDYLSNIHYYSLVDKGLIYLVGSSNAASVACRSDGLLYYTPMYDGIDDRAPMIRLTFTGNTSPNAKQILPATDTVHGGGRTTMQFSYTIVAGGVNDPWGVGRFVTLTGFSGAHVGFNNQSLAITAYSPGGAPPTFSVSILGNFSASNYSADAYPSGTIYQQNPTYTTVSIDGSGSSSNVYNQLSFQSTTSFSALAPNGDVTKYTLAGDVATSNAAAEPGENPTLFAVKSSTPFEFAYPASGDHAVRIYNKKY
jgi:hypothetical protein